MYTREIVDSEPVMREFRVCLRQEVTRRGRRRLRFQEAPAEVVPPGPDPGQRREEEQRVSRLIADIGTIRSELARVQTGYKAERDGWMQETSALQQQLSQLGSTVEGKQRSLREKDQRYKQQLRALKSQNRELSDTLKKERQERPFEDASTQRALEDLVSELYAMKKELTELRRRYNEERARWRAANDELDGRVRSLLKENEGDELALAESTMFYYQQFDQMKKENFCLKEDLEEERRQNKALKIQVDVLREEVMRTKEAGGDAARPADGGHQEEGAAESQPSPGPRQLSRMASVAEEEEEVFADRWEPQAAAQDGPGRREDSAMAERIAELEKKNQDLQLELAKSQDSVADAGGDKARLIEELQSQRAKNADLVGKYKTQERELDQARRDNEASAQEAQRLKDEAAVKRKELKEVKEEMVRRTDELNDLQRAKSAEERQKSDRERQLEEEKRRAEDEVQALSDQLADMRQRDKVTRDKMAALRDRISSSKENCDKLRSDFRELESFV